jgi:hypothetical protein
MTFLEYGRADKRRIPNWTDRYVIAGCVIAILHFLGSIFLDCYSMVNMMTDSPLPPATDRFFPGYEFPAWELTGHCGVPHMGSSIGMLFTGSIVNALCWGGLIIWVWHFFRRLTQKSQRTTDR